ncbi:MAG: GNAT family N-acetyltransferase [Clostridiales bacterium]|nr:GNAT family N-acetyltransferase [Clostridiales bacterium]
MEKFVLRPVLPQEAEETIEIEYICFPPNEACTPKSMRERARYASECFLVAEDAETKKIAGFLDGVATNENVFRDEFFTDISLHDPAGQNVMLLGLDVLPEYRGRGLARRIMAEYAARQKSRGKRALYLTCHERLVPMYTKMGYKDLGLSASVWGGVQWNDMVMEL